MEAFVITARFQIGKRLLRTLNHRYRDLIVGELRHDLTVQDEALLVFQDTDAQAPLDRHASLAFADPFGMPLKQGKYFFVMRDGFTVQNAPPDWVDLAFGIPTENL
ncbi:MAG: hypothetical protein CVV13_10965 [Gammaproteobacteria bacterium HGW-Gammaproteobacteria-3]|nr:MAG: hypothetical protein CVV13_10965 [Gammaproteobacteria bacterium HGW-Gammaproteobacteria-3]